MPILISPNEKGLYLVILPRDNGNIILHCYVNCYTTRNLLRYLLLEQDT